MRLPCFFQLPFSFTLFCKTPFDPRGVETRGAASHFASHFASRFASGLACAVVLAIGGCSEPPDAAPLPPPRDSIPWDAPFPTDFDRQEEPWPVPESAWHEFRLVGRKDAVGDNWMPLRLLEPMTGQWELAGGVPEAENQESDDRKPAAASANVDPGDLRVELRLLPRSLPRWRLVGSSTLNAAQDSTWIEFIQSQSDQVLKLKVDCRWTKGLELLVAAHFQLAPELPTVQLTQRNLFQAEQFTTGMGQRLTAQLQWISARTASGGSGAPKTAVATWNEQRKQLEKQLKQVTSAAQRLEHLKSLQQTLEQEGRLHVRLVHATTGQELKLAPVGQASSLSPAPITPPAHQPPPPKSKSPPPFDNEKRSARKPPPVPKT